MHHMLSGAAAGLQHVAGFAREKFFQHLPDRLIVAVERRRIEAAVRTGAVAAEFSRMLSHDSLSGGLSLQIAANDFSNALFSMG